jgi:hypothetical protein
MKAVVLALTGEREAAAKALQDALSHGASASVAREDDDLWFSLNAQNALFSGYQVRNRNTR